MNSSSLRCIINTPCWESPLVKPALTFPTSIRLRNISPHANVLPVIIFYLYPALVTHSNVLSLLDSRCTTGPDLDLVLLRPLLDDSFCSQRHSTLNTRRPSDVPTENV